MNSNIKIDALDAGKNGKSNEKTNAVDKPHPAIFMVVTLILGWMVVLLIMMNGGHGFL